MNIRNRVAAALERPPLHLEPLAGGCVGEVYRVAFAQGDDVVIKVDSTDGTLGSAQLDLEGRMLRDLAPHLPVPKVLIAEPDLLILERLPSSDGNTEAAEQHAAELLANLHRVTQAEFGLSYDTLIGGLPQANPPSSRWVPFFAEHRVLAMARQALERRRIDVATMHRIAALVNRLDRYLEEPDRPSLLHGDVWSGNVLVDGDRVAGFVDPAIYYGHYEAELAFIQMFSTFGAAFFDEYYERRAIDTRLTTARRDLYNLYPYLVHVRLFGGGYLDAVERIVQRFAD